MTVSGQGETHPHSPAHRVASVDLTARLKLIRAVPKPIDSEGAEIARNVKGVCGASTFADESFKFLASEFTITSEPRGLPRASVIDFLNGGLSKRGVAFVVDHSVQRAVEDPFDPGLDLQAFTGTQ